MNSAAINNSNSKPGLRPSRPGNWRRQITGLLTGSTFLLLTLLGSGVGSPAAAAEVEASENQIKAAFLFNFPKYVEWPAEAHATTNSPIIVRILGDANLADEFKKISEGKTINGRPLLVQTAIPGAGSPADCHLLYLGSAVRRPADMLTQLRGRSILTVSTDDHFLESGGIIRFVRQERKIRLQVHLANAQQAQLKISSKLLSVADVVKGHSKQG
jgi:hypothetical protein